jgi:drug/metabolite transporter (DMT)-like permease
MAGRALAATPPRLLPETAQNTVAGIALAVLCNLMWTIGDTGAKWAIPAAGVGGAMLFRGLFGGAVVLGISGLRQGGWWRLVPVRGWPVALRSALSCFVSLTWFLSWREMALADTYAIGFTAPLIMTLMAVPLLGERIHWRRILSTLAGFLGVLVMLRPGGDLWRWETALLLVGIVVMAFTRIMTRQLSATETPECQAFSLSIGQVLLGTALLAVAPFPGVLTGGVWLALAVLGVSSGLAQCVYARSYALAPVSALAPYDYTALIWGVAAGYFVFHELPAWTTLAGASIVVAAGLYNLHRERVRSAAGR